jgi:putative membrane-bound dehydrogenase-like protein
LLSVPRVLAQLPTVLDDRLVIELVAKEPDIVTPTGIAVDERGRVWCIENNTHQRPSDYKGHPSDRIRIYDDFDANGRARRVKTFADGFKNSMGLALDRDGRVFLATRSEIFVLRDTKGNDTAGEKKSIIKLDTKGDYPHNGLCGFAFDALGYMYFGLGENLGEAYKLIGSDGWTLSGGGEGGNIYRCRPDGTKLVRVATGFWNPFAMTVDAFGRLFAVDNDPDSRGPCRLLHIIQGGDYGYRFRNGRKGTHPFTAWNGELPGTLPMVAGTAEAPSGIVAYESNGLPKEYIGQLISTSWGDHVIERFELKPRGASFTSQAKTLVKGDENFRPVGIITAPDGSLVFSDWVDKSYPVHGKGRIWRLRMKQPPRNDDLRPSQLSALPIEKVLPFLLHPRIEIRRAASDTLVQRKADLAMLKGLLSNADERGRLQVFWTALLLRDREFVDLAKDLLDDKTPEVRAQAVYVLGCLARMDPKEFGGLGTFLVERVKKDPSAQVMLAALHPGVGFRVPKFDQMIADKDPFIQSAALTVWQFDGIDNPPWALRKSPDPALRVGLVLILRRLSELLATFPLQEGNFVRSREEAILESIPDFLADPDPGVRRAAIQWIAEERLQQYGKLLPAAASKEPVTKDLFEAWLAANDFLSGKKRLPTDEPTGEDFIAKILKDDKQPVTFRTLAMRMLRPDHPALDTGRLKGFLASKEAGLRREVVRTLVMRADEPSQELLRHLATEENGDPGQRAAVVAGLGHSAASSRATQRLLLSMLDKPELRRDALRSLRPVTPGSETERVILDWWEKLKAEDEAKRELAEQIVLAVKPGKDADDAKQVDAIAKAAGPKPSDEEGWRKALEGKGDPAAGERLFFHPRGPRCFACHRIDGRGAAIGPDLSTIGRSLSRDKLIESILAPSKEIAPQFVSWIIVTKDGKSRTGMIVEEKFDSTIVIANAEGRLETINRLDIEDRQAAKTSIMPDNLPALMTRQEFRDLLAYLSERK